ncbi:leucine-rich repeat domain-containing protein [uncultured Treponema sp.]|uniref:leucine-rich repeat domain-containing protein n=1 Tax=uncultured Treponema sp. TaxID=162155 RepID=UPI0025E02D1B|nr:leucine-rich repeat domain-containing protein [uncultured Treponema sp.]
MPCDTIRAKINGPLNGTDVKYLRELIIERNLASIDLSNSQIVSGGDVYYQNDEGEFATKDNEIGFYMFAECRNLKEIKLPLSIAKIEKRAFQRTGITNLEIPENITLLCYGAFSNCDSLETVIIGKNVEKMNQGVFYSSKVKNVYVYAKTPPTLAAYMFTSKPEIHVYAESLEAYQATKWADSSYGGTLIGDLTD